MYCKMDQILLIGLCPEGRGHGPSCAVCVCECAFKESAFTTPNHDLRVRLCTGASASVLYGERAWEIHRERKRGWNGSAHRSAREVLGYFVFVQACWPTMKHSEGMCGARSEEGWKFTSIRTKLFSRASAFHNPVQTACNDPNGLQRANRSSAPTEMQKIIATKVERIRSGVASGRTGWCRDRQQRPDAPSSSAAGERWTQQTTRSLWGPQASSRVAQTYPACIASMCGGVGFISVGGALYPASAVIVVTPPGSCETEW